MDKPTVVSLFAGIGGIDLAFEQAGFNVIWANEQDHHACVTYRLNFPNKPIIEGDIRNINTDDIPKADVVVAGFPCQSFSIMGHRRGFNDSRGALFFEIAGFVKEIQPSVIFLENVRNLIHHDNGKTFITIYNTLSELGYFVKYDVESPHTHANIPQERNRTFVVAFADIPTMNKFSFPDKFPLSRGINDIIDRSVKHNDNYYYGVDNKYYPLLDSRIPDKTGIYRIDDSGVATRKYEISPTLKANMGTYHDRVPIIRDDFGLRKLTPFECLALQGFPTGFEFKDIPIEAAYKQCGNTVCVPVVKQIAERIYKCLRG